MSNKPKKLSFGGATPEQQAIIHGESPQGGKTTVMTAEEQKPASKEKEKPKKPRATSKAKNKPAKATTKEVVSKVFEGPLINQTYRIPSDLAEAILRASMERKLKKAVPYTQQDIVAEALKQWLVNNP